MSTGAGRSAGRTAALAEICQAFHVATLYVFGSRADKVAAWVVGNVERLSAGPSDVDVGVRPIPGQPLSVREKVELAIALEDLWDVSRVDLVSLPEADPFVAANVVRGECLYARDAYEEDEYLLYILRRAGDLIPLERERQTLILGGR